MPLFRSFTSVNGARPSRLPVPNLFIPEFGCRMPGRLKVADNTSPKRVVYLHITGDELADTPQTTGLTLLGTDFRKAGEYQEFSMEFIRY